MSANYEAFGPQMPVQKKQRLPITRTQIVLGIAGLLVLAIAAWAIVASILPTEKMIKTDFLDACTADVTDKMRDPSSTELDVTLDDVLYSDDSGKYTALSEGRSRNGFGGMNSFVFACSGTYDESAGSFDLESSVIGK